MASTGIPLLDFDAAIVAAVKADHTAIPDGTWDLSGDGKVFRGRFVRPVNEAGLPFVGISGPSVPSSESANVPLGCYGKQASWDVLGFAPWARTGADEVTAAIEAGVKLMRDVTYAIEESARGAGGAGTIRDVGCLRDLVVEATTLLEGDGVDLPPGYGGFFATVTIEYTIARGV